MSTAIYSEEQKYTPSAPGTKRALGDDAVPAPKHNKGSVPADFRTVNGWGADLDPKNRPAYPQELPSDVKTPRGAVGDRQVPTVKIHQSIEHPDLTPVFGTSCPPKGLSGLLKDYAYQFSENSNRHWMTLMLSNKVDVLESLLSSPFEGKPDRYIKEKGWSAKVKYADSEQRRKYLLVAGAALGAVGLAVWMNRTLVED
jgi:hypothetical protein